MNEWSKEALLEARAVAAERKYEALRKRLEKPTPDMLAAAGDVYRGAAEGASVINRRISFIEAIGRACRAALGEEK